MRPLSLILAMVLITGAQPAYSQIVIATPPVPNNGDIIGCSTRSCQSAVEEVRRGQRSVPTNRAGFYQCSQANQDLGRWIGQVSRNITTRYDRGELNYDQAADIRNLIYSETFVLRNILRAEISNGDVRRCEDIKNRAIIVVNQIFRSALGYKGPVRTEGFAYGQQQP